LIDQKEFVYERLLGIGCQELRSGEPLYALAICGPLSNVEFAWRRTAKSGEFAALDRLGEFKERFIERVGTLEDLLKTFRDPTAYRATIIKQLAEVRITLQDLGDIDERLEEASQILEKQCMPAEKGTIVYLQGLVALQRGEYEFALEMLGWGAVLRTINIPEVVPAIFAAESLSELLPTEQLPARTLVGSSN
jgi:hypothetical protein